ncbi:MAG: hypothetical protein ISS25_02620 [Nanoarchaeota archaeon]|nr:hypothetical protein [DPANN group archaeon]MBL7116697.1 hypothetical protein [Nanoarchaeota archaeon]
MFMFGFDENDMFRIGDLVIEGEKKYPEYTQKIVKKWEPYRKKFYDVCDEISSVNLSILSDKELSNLYKRFSDSYIGEFTLPLIADAMGYYLETKINKALKAHVKKLGREKEFNKILTILSTPVDQTFFGDEKYELLSIVKDYLKGKNVKEKIKKHQKKWCWIQNNYLRAVILDEKYFMDRTKEHSKKPEKVKDYLKNYKSNLKKAKEEKERLMDELALGEYLRLLVRMIEEYGLWQDKRKKANLIGDHYIALFLKEAEKRTGISMNELECTTGIELQALFNNKKIDLDALKKRLEVCGIVYTKESPEIFDYEDTVLLEKELKSFNYDEIFGDIHGTVANLGKVTGTAKIIQSPTEFDKMQEGDIIITSMTRPEFVPIIKKAGAIVTDEGGITCHAAIVSRELGIPCIIGTKVATKILKDGDKIEVNANHGIIRRV